MRRVAGVRRFGDGAVCNGERVPESPRMVRRCLPQLGLDWLIKTFAASTFATP